MAEAPKYLRTRNKVAGIRNGFDLSLQLLVLLLDIQFREPAFSGLKDSVNENITHCFDHLFGNFQYVS